MPVYTIRFKDDVISQVDTDAPRVRIGRSEECELRIDNLGVSRFHAVVEMQDGMRVLKDLGSHNGVFFNGKPVKNRVLNNGDVFVIGKYRLEYQDRDNQEGDQKQDSYEMPVGPSMDDIGMKTFAIDPAALAHLQQAERVKGYLRRQDGKVHDLRQTITTFGKSERCDYRLRGFFTPPVVAVIIRDERGFIAINTTGNPHKVLVQDRPLPMYVRLENGFKITLVKTAYTFNSGRAVD